MSSSTYSLEELGEALVNDGLDHLAVDVGEPDAHQCACHQQDREKVNVTRLATLHRGEDNLGQPAQPFPKHSVHIASTLFTC